MLPALIALLITTLLFPALAWIATAFRSKKYSAVQATTSPLQLSVLIPAFNEESQITETLNSIQAAASRALVHCPQLQIRILVGDNGSTDRTVQLAKQAGAEVLSSDQNLGKWKMLQKLIDASQTPWVALVDAGCRWKSDLLVQWLGSIQKHDVIAVAPAYFPSEESGWLERISWGLERFLKTFENRAGGPVSIHGATVFYLRQPLLNALQFLRNSGDNWFNDDVVIPMTLRMQNPNAKIWYLSRTGASDLHGEKPIAQNQARRRQRLVAGNVQWVRYLLLPMMAKNPIAAILSMRRIARILWIYWAFLAYFTLTLMFISWSASLSLALAAIVLVLFVARGAFDAAIASLLSPYLLLNKHLIERMAWR